MVRGVCALVAAACACALAAPDNASYTFCHWLRRGEGARRLYAASVRTAGWGAVCAVQDARRVPACSGAVLAPRWALTAAHCVAGAHYVHYNSEHAQAGGAAAAVAARYQHPHYRVTVRVVAGVPEVRALQHDVGLLQAAADMTLATVPHPPPLDAINMFPPDLLINSKLEVLGFGRWEGGQAGEELRAASLTAVSCGRAAWRACVCGAGAGGVCAGDSGGPALRGGALVALSSLGPVYCARASSDGRAPASVLTALQPYAELLLATVQGDASRPRMRRLQLSPRRAGAAAAPLPSLPLLLLAAGLRR